MRAQLLSERIRIFVTSLRAVLRSESTLKADQRFSMNAPSEPKWHLQQLKLVKMAKKLLFVTVLLLLVSVQAMKVSCELRCSLMRASTDCHAMQTDEEMPHCHAMSMEHDKQASATASDSCTHAACGTDLTAITKCVDQKDAGPSKLLVSAVVLSVDSFGSRGPTRAAAFAALSRGSGSSPYTERPGSSLRI